MRNHAKRQVRGGSTVNASAMIAFGMVSFYHSECFNLKRHAGSAPISSPGGQFPSARAVRANPIVSAARPSNLGKSAALGPRVWGWRGLCRGAMCIRPASRPLKSSQPGVPRHGDELARSGTALALSEKRSMAILWVHELCSGSRELSPATAMRPRSAAKCSMKR